MYLSKDSSNGTHKIFHMNSSNVTSILKYLYFFKPLCVCVFLF